MRGFRSPRPNSLLRHIRVALLMGSLAGSCWAFATLGLPALANNKTTVLGVVRSAENEAHWPNITQRLQTANIAFQTVDLSQINSPADLSGLTVLFLPSVETLTTTQVLALETWMSQGGRLIASGPVGNLSPLGVRQTLRSLLGAYWAFPLPQPTTLQQVTTQSQHWIRQGTTTSPVWGGVVVPTGLNSQTAATWKGAQTTPNTPGLNLPLPYNSPAIVTTERTTFLGWHWGGTPSGPVEFDSAWLRAAISRYGPVPSAGANTAQASPPNVTAVPRPAKPLPRITVRPAATPPPTALVRPPGFPLPPTPLPTGTDPAEQVAPAGLEVSPSTLPITTLEAIAMRQELENLMGRVESALVSANALDTRRAQSGSREELLTSAGSAIASSKEATQTAPSTKTALTTAQQLLQSFPQLLANREYATARQQWLEARQSLLESYPTDRRFAQPEVRAIWLDRGTIVRAGSEQNLAALFDRLAAAGVNTVFLETVNAGYPIYPSRVAPQQNPLIRNWDPLASAVKLAHQRNMELHAWAWIFAAGNQAHNALINLPPTYPGPLLAANPHWANYDNRGNVIPVGQTKPFLDPANPEVRRYLTQLLSEIVSRYKVDGVQLDYIRYPFQDPGAGRTYGYGRAAREQFQQLTGVDPITLSPRDLPPNTKSTAEEAAAQTQRNRELWQQWTHFRAQQVNTFVAEVSQELRKIRPNLILSAAVFPLPEHERTHKIQQQWEVWARQGDIDLLVPMTYALDTNRFQRLLQPVLSPNSLGSTLMLPSIRLLNLPEPATLDQIQASRNLPASGYALFAAENLSDRLHNIFSQTQGSVQRTPKEPIPYRAPFAAASARYQSLQQEWDFLLSNQQLQMREPMLTTWRQETQRLDHALQELAKNPSAEHLTTAQQTLKAFRTRFRDRLRLQTRSSGYLVQAWDNRLAAIETLLQYGERTLSRSNRR